MTTVIKTNPDLPSGDTWNTTTYTPAATVGKYGGNTNQFNVVSGAVILGNRISISGDSGIIFPDATLNEVDPTFTAGATEITYDATQNAQTGSGSYIVEVIRINVPLTVIDNSVRITLEAYRDSTDRTAGGRVFHYSVSGVLKNSDNAIPVSAGVWTAFSFDYSNVQRGDYFVISVFGGTYTSGKSTIDVTGYTRYVRSRTDGSTWQSTYPNGITRSDSL